jgi:hypothetical protein
MEANISANCSSNVQLDGYQCTDRIPQMDGNDSISTVNNVNTTQRQRKLRKFEIALNHTCINPLLASRCGVFQNRPPADVHDFSDLFHLKPFNLVKVKVFFITNIQYSIYVHTVMLICR